MVNVLNHLRTSVFCITGHFPCTGSSSQRLAMKNWTTERQTWLRTVEDDLRPLNFGLATSRRRAMDRPAWRLLVDAATSSWHGPEKERGREREVLGFTRGPGHPHTNWRSTVNKDLLRMGITWKEQRWQLRTDQNGVGVWPNASTWMRVESRLRYSGLGLHSHWHICFTPGPQWGTSVPRPPVWAVKKGLDWTEWSLTPHPTQYWSFRRRSSQPITWLLLTNKQ